MLHVCLIYPYITQILTTHTHSAYIYIYMHTNTVYMSIYTHTHTHTHTHTYIYIYIYIYSEGILNAKFIVDDNGIDNPSSDIGRVCLPFPSR